MEGLSSSPVVQFSDALRTVIMPIGDLPKLAFKAHDRNIQAQLLVQRAYAEKPRVLGDRARDCVHLEQFRELPR